MNLYTVEIVMFNMGDRVAYKVTDRSGALVIDGVSESTDEAFAVCRDAVDAHAKVRA